MTDTPQQFNEDRSDALQEVVNIAMGQAGDALAKLFDTFVELSVPKFYVCDIAELHDILSHKETYREQLTILRQPFSGRLRGEGVVLLNDSGVRELAGLMGYAGEITINNQREMVLDVCSILVGACLNGIASQMEIVVSYTAPSLIATKSTVDDFIRLGSIDWKYALVMDVFLSLEQYSFSSNMLFFLSKDSFSPLMENLDRLLGEL